MALLIIFIAVASSILSVSFSEIILNKCCLQRELLVYDVSKDDIICQKYEDSRKNLADNVVSQLPVPQWLMEVVDIWRSSNVQRSKQNYTKILPNNLKVRYGNRPCLSYDLKLLFPSEPMDTSKPKYHLFRNGSLLLHLNNLGGSGEIILNSTDYCLDEWDDELNNAKILVINACPCLRVPCFRKCCAYDEEQVYTEEGLYCNESLEMQPNESWRPFRENESVPVHHLISDGNPLNCSTEADDDSGLYDVIDLNREPGDRRHVYVQANGGASFETISANATFPAGRWCGESILLENGTRIQNAQLCHLLRREPVTDRHITYASLQLVSSVFLALTLLVYALLPELRAPPHAKALMAHCGALLAGSLALASMQLTAVMPDALCEFGAMIIQFSFLAAFFWLNVLCIDISWAFSGLRGLLGSLLDTSRRKFLYYSLYAWGSPLLISAVTVGLQVAHRKRTLPQWVIVPNVGSKICWLDGEAAHWAFFYGPMAALLAANLALFVFTAARLAAAHCDAAQLNRGDSVRHDRSSRLSSEKRRLILYAKLFLLMGVTWVLEVVSWSVRQDKDASDVEPAWFFSDVINTLRGVFIFIIFCCKRKVLHMLRKRWGAWGLPGGLPPGCSTRSPTYRSQTSTRQSSLLQLSPLSELGIYTVDGDACIKSRRNSPVQVLPAANGDPYAKAPRRVSLPPETNGTKSPRRLSPASGSPNINGGTIGDCTSMAPRRVSLPPEENGDIGSGTRSPRRNSPVYTIINGDPCAKTQRRVSLPPEVSEDTPGTTSPRRISFASGSPNISGNADDNPRCRSQRRVSLPPEPNGDSGNRSPRRASPTPSLIINGELATEEDAKTQRRVSLQLDTDEVTSVSSGSKSPRRSSPVSILRNISENAVENFAQEQSQGSLLPDGYVNFRPESPRRSSSTSSSPNSNRHVTFEICEKQPRRVSLCLPDTVGDANVDSGARSPRRLSPASISSNFSEDAVESNASVRFNSSRYSSVKSARHIPAPVLPVGNGIALDDVNSEHLHSVPVSHSSACGDAIGDAREYRH